MSIDNNQELKMPGLFELSLWMGTPEIDWSCLTRGQPLKRFKKNEVIFRQEDPCSYIYIVKRGRVRLEIYSASGDARSLFIAEEGSIFGELSVLDGQPHFFNATTSSDCMLYLIPVNIFRAELATNHQLALDLLRINSKKTRLMSMLIKQLSFNDSSYRVSYAMVNLVQQYSQKLDDGSYKLNIKFTHQEMANLTGLSRVSVSNILLQMTSDGIIEKDVDGYVIVRDLARLEKKP